MLLLELLNAKCSWQKTQEFGLTKGLVGPQKSIAIVDIADISCDIRSHTRYNLFTQKVFLPIPPLLGEFVTLAQQLYSRVKKMRKAKPPAEMMVIDSQEEDTHNNWCVHLSVV